MTKQMQECDREQPAETVAMRGFRDGDAHCASHIPQESLHPLHRLHSTTPPCRALTPLFVFHSSVFVTVGNQTGWARAYRHHCPPSRRFRGRHRGDGGSVAVLRRQIGEAWRGCSSRPASLWVLFALAIFTLRLVPRRAAIVLVLVGSVAVGGAAMAGPPNTSTDSARYAWDGIVQSAGISPYDHVPADPALDDLRPEWLFPAGADADGEPRAPACAS